MRKNTNKFVPTAIIAVLLLLLLFILINLLHNNGKIRTETEIKDATQLYSNAALSLSSQTNLQVETYINEIISKGSNTFHNETHLDISYMNCGSTTQQVYVDETLTMGNYTTLINSIYIDNMQYHTVNGTHFSGKMDSDPLTIYPPALLIDPVNYQSISGIQYDDFSIVIFDEPFNIENWVTDKDMQFEDAYGLIWLDKYGNITKSTYNIRFSKNEITVLRSTTVSIIGFENGKPDSPLESNEYIEVSCPNAAKQLEIACGYLLQLNDLQANHTDTVTCEVFGDTKVSIIDVHMGMFENEPSLDLATSITVTNSSRAGEVSSSTQHQTFKSGKYTCRTDGGSPVTTEDTSYRDLFKQCQEVLVGTVMLPQYISGTQMTETEDTYRLEFTANEDFIQKIEADAAIKLYGDADLLNELSSTHKTDDIYCYLDINKATGLPLSSGIHYTATYYVSDLPYHLSYIADQTYMIP